MPGFQEMKYHIIFDVKPDFTRKARLVVGGHMVETPSQVITHSTVVSSVIFLMAQLLDLNILSVDIGNAYQNAKCDEKVWCEAGSEFGQDWCGKILIVRRALYELRSAGASWRTMLKESMIGLGYILNMF